LSTPVYIDVEGDPDRGYYYCIGIRFEVAGSIVQNSYWADGPSDGRKNDFRQAIHREWSGLIPPPGTTQ
jgi:hypothetical protein